MQRARIMGRKDCWYSKWFVIDISVHKAYGTLTILPGDPELSHVSPRYLHIGEHDCGINLVEWAKKNS
jgi:hypothetical protein